MMLSCFLLPLQKKNFSVTLGVAASADTTLFLDEESVQVRRSIDAIWIRGKVLVYEVRIDLGFRHSSRST
jgi:hypothetical protein